MRISTPLTASDATVAGYADFYFEYNSDQRVTKEDVDGAKLTFTFSYTDGTHADDVNQWKRKTVETLPDGTQNIVYTNYIGQVLVKDFKSGNDNWIQYHQYDSNARQIQAASPSAVASYVDNAGGGGNELSVTLNSSAGLISVTDYYSSTTATSSTAGGVDGYAQYEKIKQGSSGTEIKLKEHKYIKHAGGLTLGGTLDVVLLGGFQPSFGDRFEVLTFDSASGGFRAYTGLELTGGLSLEPNLSANALTLTVVPEPSTLTLLALALGLLMFYRFPGRCPGLT